MQFNCFFIDTSTLLQLTAAFICSQICLTTALADMNAGDSSLTDGASTNPVNDGDEAYLL